MTVHYDEAPWHVMTVGEFTLTIVTRRRAEEDGIPIHPTASYVAALCYKEGHITHISFTDITGLREFIVAMKPRAVSLAACAERPKSST